MPSTAVLQGNTEAIQQCLDFLSNLTEKQYCYVDPNMGTSAIGAHMRHILDMYRALMQPTIDYDVRRRQAECETEMSLAKAEFQQIQQWLSSLEPSAFVQPITVRTEVTLKDTNSVELQSTLLRELVFVSSHTVHHLAIISLIARQQGVTVDALLGVAPATATYLKQQIPF